MFRPKHSTAKNLIIVCCHSTYTGDGNDFSESQWILAPFQRSDSEKGKPSEHEAFIAHILAGEQALHNDPYGLLIFSGGRTTNAPLSEAESYMAVLKGRKDASERWKDAIYEEKYATDSYQNLLFSILFFRNKTGAYPEHITVVTHAFKERRFLELHGPAIKWPAYRIRVQGINPPFTLDDLQQTQAGERKNGYVPFEHDPYGVNEPLSGKRERRHWTPGSVEMLAFEGLEPQVERLLRWKGGSTGRDVFPEQLPWEA